MATKNPDSASRLGGVLISNQVVAELLEQLRNGIWQDTDHLPPELELANRLNVSRTVVRDALSELERAGYIERVRGIGTVVNRTVLGLRSRLDQKLEYYPLIRSFGSYPHADGIQIYPVRAGEELARDLAIEPGDDVICIKKRILFIRSIAGGSHRNIHHPDPVLLPIASDPPKSLQQILSASVPISV